MVITWARALHRNGAYRKDPDAFDPDRLSAGREAEHPPGAYIHFGQGPRICIGTAFATVQAGLIVSGLITRPKHQIWIRVRQRT